MVTLRRIVRMGIGGQPAGIAPELTNGYGGNPAYGGWPQGRFVELEVCCRGEVDPRTGYFIDIKAVDRAARETLGRAFTESLSTPDRGEVELLASTTSELNSALGHKLVWVRWNVTPKYSVEVSPMQARSALLRQKFEIAAAHRLHVPELSEEENRRIFGRCANPSAHGHNYVIEPTVRVELNPAGKPAFTLADLERTTLRTLIDPFDHRNLNVDCPQFDVSKGGVNPSVENISRVFYELLSPDIAKAGAQLASITVWETEKTCSTYPG